MSRDSEQDGSWRKIRFGQGQTRTPGSTAATRSWRCGPDALRRALEEFRRFGGAVSGGDSEGQVRTSTPLGPLEGSYRFDGEVLTVVIDSKPAMLPIEMIWNRLDQICGPPIVVA